MVLFCIGTLLMIDGIFMDPFAGNQYIKTSIKITSYSPPISSHYTFNFNENFSCKQCLSTTNICSYDSPCPNIVSGYNYTYYCDCSKYICGFKPYNYYTTDAFIVLIVGVSLIAIIICLTLIKCCISALADAHLCNGCNKKNSIVSSEQEIETINIDVENI